MRLRRNSNDTIYRRIFNYKCSIKRQGDDFNAILQEVNRLSELPVEDPFNGLFPEILCQLKSKQNL